MFPNSILLAANSNAVLTALTTPTPAPEQRVILLFAGRDNMLHPELRSVPLPETMAALQRLQEQDQYVEERTRELKQVKALAAHLSARLGY